MDESKELIFARQYRKLLDNKTLGAGKWMDLAYQYGIQACDLITSLTPEADKLILLFADIRKLMIEDAEQIASEFSGGKEGQDYCKDTKTLTDKIDEIVLKLKKG